MFNQAVELDEQLLSPLPMPRPITDFVWQLYKYIKL